MSAGSSLQDTVVATWRRSGTTGRGTPASAATAAAQGPAALTTAPTASRSRVVSTSEAANLGPPHQAHAQPRRAGEVPLEDPERPDEPVGGAERTARDPVEPDRGIDAGDLRRRDFLGLDQPLGVLDRATQAVAPPRVSITSVASGNEPAGIWAMGLAEPESDQPRTPPAASTAHAAQSFDRKLRTAGRSAGIA